MTCKDCGGTMTGDGYNSVSHCEDADEREYEFHAPDEGPVYCGNYQDVDPGKPIHEHDCECCKFLGTTEDKHDLYYCANMNGTVISRFSSLGSGYSSGICFIIFNDIFGRRLALAAQRAIDKGYLTIEDLVTKHRIEHVGRNQFINIK